MFRRRRDLTGPTGVVVPSDPVPFFLKPPLGGLLFAVSQTGAFTMQRNGADIVVVSARVAVTVVTSTHLIPTTNRLDVDHYTSLYGGCVR